MAYKTIFFFLLVFSCLNVKAFANSDSFAKMDANSDGKVSLKEFKTVFPSMHDAAFTTIDSNGDKAIDRAEWDAFTKNHAAGMKPANMPPTNHDTTHKYPERPLITPPNQQK